MDEKGNPISYSEGLNQCMAILGMGEKEFANALGVQKQTFVDVRIGYTELSRLNMERIYVFMKQTIPGFGVKPVAQETNEPMKSKKKCFSCFRKSSSRSKYGLVEQLCSEHQRTLKKRHL